MSINHLITTAIFQTGFDSITSFQAAIMQFNEYDHKSLFSIEPLLVIEMKTSLEVALSKQG